MKGVWIAMGYEKNRKLASGTIFLEQVTCIVLNIKKWRNWFTLDAIYIVVSYKNTWNVSKVETKHCN